MVASFRRLSSLVALALLLATASAADGWFRPAAAVDAEDRWEADAAAIDGAATTYADDHSDREGYGAWLELDLAEPTRCDRVRVLADFGFGMTDAVDVDVLVDG